MRKISRDAAEAFKYNEAFKRDNTEVIVTDKKVVMKLHGNTIAIKDFLAGGEVRLDNCGYTTNVTKERLNAIIEAYGKPHTKIFQKDSVWYRHTDAGSVNTFDGNERI
jgi:hypothetical protein